MLIHELSRAVQQDRERDLRGSLRSGRHLASLPRRARAGLLSRLGTHRPA